MNLSRMTNPNMKKRTLNTMMTVVMESKASPAKRRRLLVQNSQTVTGTKRKITMNNGAEEPMVAMEPQATTAKRRRLSVPCCSSVMAMTRSGSSTNRYNKRKSADDTLMLHALPYATQINKRTRSFSKFLHLEVKQGNYVHGEILGQRCIFLVDSGATSNYMYLSQAKKLGLVTGNEKKVTQTFFTWHGRKELQNILLEGVGITLEGFMTMRIPMKVLPKKLEKLYATPENIVLGQQFLQPGCVFQEFSASGTSKLYIRQPKRLQQPPRRFRKYQTMWMEVLRNGCKPTPVLLDTGAPDFHTTKSLMKDTDCSAVPQQVKLYLRDGNFLTTKLRVRKANDEFFILGLSLLHKYEAIVDYSRAFITFKVGGKKFRVFRRNE